MTNPRHAFARTDRSPIGVWWWTTDHLLLGATAILIILGVLLSFTSSPAAAARMHISDPFHFAIHQCFFAAGGSAPSGNGSCWGTSMPSAASNSNGGRKIASSVSLLGRKLCTAPGATLIARPSTMPASASNTA